MKVTWYDDVMRWCDGVMLCGCASDDVMYCAGRYCDTMVMAAVNDNLMKTAAN